MQKQENPTFHPHQGPLQVLAGKQEMIRGQDEYNEDVNDSMNDSGAGIAGCAFCFCAVHIGNDLPFVLGQNPSVPAFKTSVKTYLFKQYFDQ